MRYSNIALQILAAKESGFFKTNAQFWASYSGKQQIEKLVDDNPSIKNKMQSLASELNSKEDMDGMVCAFDDDFPVINRKVKNKSEKPFLLYYRGDISLLEELNNNVAVIGYVDPTEDIVKRECEIVRRLTKNNLTIVSGLAVGCDTIAHKECLESGGKTIAILPSQVDMVFPSQNKELADEIVDIGGLLVSEYYHEAKSKNEAVNRFIERDRLQAMFSKAVILIASYRKDDGDSGSRHAMEAARKYEIERFAMYSQKIDESNRCFGLNKDLTASTEKSPAKVIIPSSIDYIASLVNMDIQKEWQSSEDEQMTMLR